MPPAIMDCSSGVFVISPLCMPHQKILSLRSNLWYFKSSEGAVYKYIGDNVKVLLCIS